MLLAICAVAFLGYIINDLFVTTARKKEIRQLKEANEVQRRTILSLTEKGTEKDYRIALLEGENRLLIEQKTKYTNERVNVHIKDQADFLAPTSKVLSDIKKAEAALKKGTDSIRKPKSSSKSNVSNEAKLSTDTTIPAQYTAITNSDPNCGSSDTGSSSCEAGGF
ncbi:hypothetical protein SEA_WEASELS2_50 [Rhodococcus phage Weasels2]|uniref:Uncharacterized protein n=1 Tax=Rhodococcus phage Weasels2 TaxID=1897437 RepID=A0A1I9SA34_9CAUD|nr:hypothetical protein FDH04_gp050 [Rhodococcus phage Weasels2]AOZ63640.1 hypothetical protein SEA_WEASELS2_50 [Rhodococcus phage Weasels2]